MELTLPMNYVELEQEEMMYLDGGDWNTFKTNIKGLISSSSAFRYATKSVGHWGAIYGAKTYAYSQVVVMFSPLLGSVTSVNWAIGLVAGVSVAAIAATLWNFKFY